MKLRCIVKDAEKGRVLVARLKPGTDLLLAIKEIAASRSVMSGVILSGAGLLQKGRFRNCKSLPEKYPITDANRHFATIEKPLEILTVSGIIFSAENRPDVHAHAVLSFVEGEKTSVVGGHVLEGSVVFGFAEIVILELKGIDMEKTFDEETQTLQLFAQEDDS